MEISVLERLVPLLFNCGVHLFKDRDLEISFKHSTPVELPPSAPVPAQPNIPNQPANPDVNDFKGNDAMNFDEVLNWSTPSQSAPTIPLTGDPQT
mgnify:CR=1 FL=1